MTEKWVGQLPSNHYVGDSINMVASCLDKNQCLILTKLDLKDVPTDIVSYPTFECKSLSNPTTVYIANQDGYYQIKVLRR